jgi:hypothetical protein
MCRKPEVGVGNGDNPNSECMFLASSVRTRYIWIKSGVHYRYVIIPGLSPNIMDFVIAYSCKPSLRNSVSPHVQIFS